MTFKHRQSCSTRSAQKTETRLEHPAAMLEKSRFFLVISMYITIPLKNFPNLWKLIETMYTQKFSYFVYILFQIFNHMCMCIIWYGHLHTSEFMQLEVFFVFSTHFCANSTGPGSSILIAITIPASIGDSTTNPPKERRMSIARFTYFS